MIRYSVSKLQDRPVEQKKSKFIQRQRLTVESNNTKTSNVYAIFYNIYVNPENVSRGVEVIEEQRETFHEFLSKRNLLEQVSVYYNMIWHNFSQRFCAANLSCIPLQYYEHAFEEVTLQDLYDYCVEYPNDLVYYVHNKGSYHPSKSNDRLRRSYTQTLLDGAHRLLLPEN